MCYAITYVLLTGIELERQQCRLFTAAIQCNNNNNNNFIYIEPLKTRFTKCFDKQSRTNKRNTIEITIENVEQMNGTEIVNT